jgi:hypothetical protein
VRLRPVSEVSVDRTRSASDSRRCSFRSRTRLEARYGEGSSAIVGIGSASRPRSGAFKMMCEASTKPDRRGAGSGR